MKYEWVDCKERLPPLSFIESDNADDPYEGHDVLVYSDEDLGICCVACLRKNQNEDSWNYGDLFWQVYIPGAGTLTDVDFEVFTKWMPLPQLPNHS